MNENHGFGIRGALGLGLFERHQGDIRRFYIDEHRPGSHIQHAVCSGDERKRWNKNLIARPDAKCMQDQVEGCRAGADCDRVLGFMHASERLLKLPHPVSHRHPAALYYLG